MERQCRNPPSRSHLPSDSAGSLSSASRRSYSNRNKNSDYKYSKYNTTSNRSYEDDFDRRSRRSRDSKSYFKKLEPKEDDVGFGGISHSDLPPVLVKFHIISHQKLLNGDGNPNASSMHHLNMQQLSKALISLLNLYEVNRSNGAILKNEAEFHSFIVLFHLGLIAKQRSISTFIESIGGITYSVVSYSTFSRDRVKGNAFCSKSSKAFQYFRMCNYKGFLCTIGAEASNLQHCILEPYVNEVRALSLSFINNGGYKLNPYPLMDLSTLLMMEESEVESFCKSYGLVTSIDESGNLSLPTKQTTFSCLIGAFQRHSFLRLK